MLKKVVLACFAACGIFTLSAATEAELKAVYELFEAQNLRMNLNKMSALSMESQIKTMPQLAVFRPEMMRFFNKYLNYEVLKADLAEIYLRYFTISEIKEITRFYRTPVGQKMSMNSAQIMSEMMLLVQKRVAENSAELSRMIAEKIAKQQLNPAK